ncbi:MAG: UbiA family prenyltransferase [Gemmatimonadota bacterium]|nr:UbiA family prenyltransferase [Gemmatimonadota bacterium]MDH5760496.1 UbiA family prenyltransferase [Gemmatimonadota bacterium]
MHPALRLIRPHQWAKNLLLLLPAAAAHRVGEVAVGGDLVRAVISFSLLASAVYAANDVADAPHDRLHPTKKARPVASGAVGTGPALALAGVLAGVSLAVAWSLPRPFLWTWAVYLALTTGYSLGLKRVVMLDVIILAALYTVRVVAGSAAVDVPLSRWFLAFAVFFFASLALLKRAVESVGGNAAIPGRGWREGDLPVLTALGAGSAVAAALVYCLYITGDDVLRLYGRPDLLWMGLPILLYWIGRAWLLAHRGEVHDDPVVFALRDGSSWGALLLMALTVWLAA